MDILNLVPSAERLNFSRNFAVARPTYLGDTLFPDIKTQNLQAEYLRMASGATMPVMASVHAFDTEAEIASRPAIDKVNIEKLLIKRKINQSERVRLLLNNGVSSSDAIVQYVFDDMGRLADSVKTRTEAAKMDVLSSGSLTINENNLSLVVDYGVPSANKAHAFTWSGSNPNILSDILGVVDAAADAGKRVTGMVCSRRALRLMLENKGIQTAIYGSAASGTIPSRDRLESLFGQLFEFSKIYVNDNRYATEAADGTRTAARFWPDNKIAFICEGVTGGVGTGLWGVTPEEEEYGPYTEKSSSQYITLTQWETPDPVAVWTKASGLFIPVLPDPDALHIATVTFPT